MGRRVRSYSASYATNNTKSIGIKINAFGFFRNWAVPEINDELIRFIFAFYGLVCMEMIALRGAKRELSISPIIEKGKV